MLSQQRLAPGGRLGHLLTNPRYRKLHATILVVGLLLHLVLHYATYIPALRPPLADLPYFRLHVLHEAEFLLIIAYAGVVFGVAGGLIAVLATAITSIPFILTPYIFAATTPGLEMPPATAAREVRDASIQVAFILAMGVAITLLFDVESKRRRAESVTAALREADRIKTNFISVASHELRSPLTSLYGFSELLLSSEVPEDRRREWVQWIHKESKRLTSIVEDMLDVSRIQSGKLAVHPERLDLPPLLQEVVRTIAQTTARHQLVVEPEEHLPPAFADHNKVVQVLNNLLSNAVKYSPNGGRITVAARYERAADRLRVSVRDPGIGIAPEDQRNLFTTFHRIHRPETEGIQGNGLGLYIVKSLVELMGGEVGVESALGRGSVFSFTLPVWQGNGGTSRSAATLAHLAE